MTDMMIILALILASAFSVSEISLAASRKIRLRQMVDEGNANAEKCWPCRSIPAIFSPWCR